MNSTKDICELGNRDRATPRPDRQDEIKDGIYSYKS